jgi:Zn-dependent protease with chaperone function
MDFFEHQEVARRKTRLLVFYYFVALALIAIAVYLAVSFALSLAAADRDGLLAWWDPLRFLTVLASTGVLVASGTAYKVAQLAQGGASVAGLLGGRIIPTNTREPSERRLLNVVEEMALASGTPIPRVYVLDEEHSINAFAAGFSTQDAVVAVTRGTLDTLNREELQAVIAHEFSHILNGDMRLNIRLMGVLFGILLIALIGRGALRAVGRGRTRSRSGKGGGGVVVILALAVLLIVIGYIGVFFAKLIKSAVSRQREFLADASSVQFTRNPSGVASALRKIWKRAGSRVNAVHAEEASHFFFANGLASSWFSAMATHPPIEERIRRIDPTFLTASARELELEVGVRVHPVARSGSSQALAGFAPDGAGVIGRTGALDADSLAAAESAIAGIPESLRIAAQSPTDAEAVVLALLISSDPGLRSRQVAALREGSDGAVADRVAAVLPAVEALPQAARAPLAGLAVTGLRDSSSERYEAFRRRLDDTIAGDNEISLFEFMLQRMVRRRLDPVFRKIRQPPVWYYGLRPLVGPVSTLLSSLAYWGANVEDEAVRAFAAGKAVLPGDRAWTLQPVDRCGLDAVDEALRHIETASPLIKRQVLGACAACVASDRKVTADEGELIRAVADSLDCPIPPLPLAPAA